MATAFVKATVTLFDGMELTVDGNSKISWDNGTYAEPRPNALSLPHIACCPGSTERCRTSCYVHGLREHAPEVYAAYEQNERALHHVLMTTPRMNRAADALGEWIAENAPGGFRWHVSGDVIGPRHATWIQSVCERAPRVPFWIYTRTLEAVRILRRAGNLAVNVSADRDNAFRAIPAARAEGARVCYLVSAPDEEIPELPPGSVIFPDYDLRGRGLAEPAEHPWWRQLPRERRRMVCPADFFGQSEQHRCGPCDKCLRPAGAG